jgi:acetyltransferase-like isoleucine patch superfamily enzyme
VALASLCDFRQGGRGVLINERSKRVIPFRPADARTVGEGCFYLDMIVWLNGDQIELGNHVGFNYGCYVNGFGGLVIGDYSNVGPGSMIHTANHNFEDLSTPFITQGWTKRPVTIGADVWIGMGVCVLPGVTIGDHAIVGAGSVVAKDIEPYTIAVGNPATAIKSRR